MTRENLEKFFEDIMPFIKSLQTFAKETNSTLVITASADTKQIEYKDYSDKDTANIMRVCITDSTRTFEDYSYKRN